MFKATLLAIYSTGSNFLADLLNIIRFGIDAPKRCQTIYIPPRDVKFTVADPGLYRGTATSGAVLSGNWDQPGYATASGRVTSIIHKRVAQKLSWDEAGAYDRMKKGIEKFGTADKCRNMDDVVRRYVELDQFIAHLKKGGSFMSRRQISPKVFRESGGVIIHVGRNGELLSSENGNHRLAIAQELGLTWIPAQVGIVHLEAVKSGAFRKLTRRPHCSQHPRRSSENNNAVTGQNTLAN